MSLLVVVSSAPLAALFGRTTQALIRRALRRVVFIHMATLGIQLMIAAAQRNFSLFAIHLDYFRRHLILELELLFEFRTLVQTRFTDVDQSLYAAFQLNKDPEIRHLRDLPSR